jgi:CYTH domain-containing protein
MISDKTYRTEFHRTFLIDALPEPLTPQASHLQFFDNYIHETRLRLRSIRVPETKEWTHILQQRFPVDPSHRGEWRYADIYLNEGEYEHFKAFEGNEIRKNRYFHEYDGRMFSFDIYLGQQLWGLNRARVEFTSLEALDVFEPPPWAVIEVTNNPFFDDANLVNRTFADVQAALMQKPAR